MRSRRLILALATSATILQAAEPGGAAKPRWEMTTYQLCFLDPPSGPAGPPDERAMQAHVASMQAMVADGRAVILGPIRDAAAPETGPPRGVVVLDLPAADARTLLAADPLVHAKRLVADCHPWMAAKGILRRPPDPLDLGPAWLGLLVRPADAPVFDEAELKEIQRGHLANIESMAASGDLVIAGPMVEDTPLRGILVFRTSAADRVRELVARDPAIQQHRLVLELYRWDVPKGVFPEVSR